MNPQEVDEPTLYSSLIAQAEFHLAGNKVLRRLLSSPSLLAGEALDLNAVLTRWHATIPSYFRLDQPPASSSDWYLFARSRLWWKFWNLQITLTRPFLHQWVSRRFESQHNLDGDREEQECKSLCTHGAHETITSIGDYIHQNKMSRVASWYALYVWT